MRTITLKTHNDKEGPGLEDGSEDSNEADSTGDQASCYQDASPTQESVTKDEIEVLILNKCPDSNGQYNDTNHLLLNKTQASYIPSKFTRKVCLLC